MQLKKRQLSIRGALAAATCSVLSQPLHASESPSDKWDVRSGILFYNEKDRINIIEPVASANRTTASGANLTVRAILDSITGSSPNGATPTNTSQTFTSPSGNSSYTTQAGVTPMRSITDTRAAFGVDYEREWDRLTTNTMSGDISKETDYFSLGFSDTLRRDYNNRLTTLAAGFGISFDIVSPHSLPVELQLASTPPPTTSGDGENDGKKKIIANVLVGVTQILSRRSLTQVNLSYTSSNGYLTDPYKLLSVVDSVSGATLDYRYEKRPGTRNSAALYWKWQYQLPEDVIYLSYRYFSDDWGITAHTADVKYRYELGGDMYLQPHYRYYKQSAADFYHHSLVNGQPVPQYASADLRLGEMTGSTIGLKFGMPLKDGEFTARVEHMLQNGTSHPGDAIGIQQNYDLYPTLDATIVQLGYRFKF
jgi:hypothetical protein